MSIPPPVSDDKGIGKVFSYLERQASVAKGKVEEFFKPLRSDPAPKPGASSPVIDQNKPTFDRFCLLIGLSEDNISVLKEKRNEFAKIAEAAWTSIKSYGQDVLNLYYVQFQVKAKSALESHEAFSPGGSEKAITAQLKNSIKPQFKFIPGDTPEQFKVLYNAEVLRELENNITFPGIVKGDTIEILKEGKYKMGGVVYDNMYQLTEAIELRMPTKIGIAFKEFKEKLAAEKLPNVTFDEKAMKVIYAMPDGSKQDDLITFYTTGNVVFARKSMSVQEAIDHIKSKSS